MVVDRDVKYLDVWANVFKNFSLKSQCKDVLHLIELLLITPFTNAKLERMFSRMNRVKADWRNKLKRERLECCLRISEGESVGEFNPDNGTQTWYEEKVRQISAARPHKYPEKRKKVGESTGHAIDISKYTLSDLENNTSDSGENDW